MSCRCVFLLIFTSLITFSGHTTLAQDNFSGVEVTTTPVADGIYMLQGAGGNMGLCIGEDGVFLIDDQFAPLTDKILAAIAIETDKPVEFVFNTHAHGDHGIGFIFKPANQIIRIAHILI